MLWLWSIMLKPLPLVTHLVFFFFLTIHPEKVITVWLFKKPLSPWPMDELSSENHWFKLFCNDNHDNTIKQFEVFLVWLDRGVETISFATEGFLPWGCLRNWDSIPVCVLRFLVIDPKPLKVEYIRVFRHTMLNTHWSQSHGKSHSIQFSAKAGFSTLITPVECHFRWACGLFEIALLSCWIFPLAHMIWWDDLVHYAPLGCGIIVGLSCLVCGNNLRVFYFLMLLVQFLGSFHICCLILFHST